MNNNTKIVYSSDKSQVYFINADARTVICKKLNCKYDVVNFLHKKLHLEDNGTSRFWDRKFFESRLLLNDSYTGKAKCHLDDTWDEEKGKQIALSRAITSYSKDKYKKLCILSDILSEAKAKVAAVKMNCKHRIFNPKYR